MTVVPGTPLDQRLVESTTAALELFGVYLGARLDLYSTLDERGPLTVGELAEAAGIDARYAQEWLEQQAVAGFVGVDDPQLNPDKRRYDLPPAHRGTLVDQDDPAHVRPLADMAVGISQVLDQVVQAYRSGGGVPYRAYGAAFRRGQGAINRPAFTHDLTGVWLPAIADLHSRLSRPGARIADVGCGQGLSTVALARAYPEAEVVGVDADSPSIDDARQFARQAGAKVQFVVGDAADLTDHGCFDAVLMLECLHDLARPVEALRSARTSLREGGSVVVADEHVAPEFTAPGDVVERMMYGWSITHCLPTQLVEKPSAAIGTVLREGRLAELAGAAGFSSTEVVPVDGGFFRIYRLADR